VGREVDLEQASQSHDAARHALAQATPSTPLVHWEELVDHGILSLLGREAGRAFADAYLAPLGTGRSPRPELVETLRAFLRHHGRIGPVAAELGVHRNTVRNRVAELESLLGRSLDDPHVRVHAWLALQAGVADG
jgi:PucR family transcriptional regulator, purine catabolism regulatory protein